MSNPADPADDLDGAVLRALIDRIVPKDEYPSAGEAGVGEFLARITSGEMAHWRSALAQGLRDLDAEAIARTAGTGFAQLPEADQDALISDLLAGKREHRWRTPSPSAFLGELIDRTIHGYYADAESAPASGPAAWAMVGFRDLPEGVTWPGSPGSQLDVTEWGGLAGHYDAIVVGAGAGGGVAAGVLAEAGLRVLVVERGDSVDAANAPRDHLRTQRLPLGYAGLGDLRPVDNPRVLAGPDGEKVVYPSDPDWHNIAMTVGGGTRLYGAQAWRFCDEDFQMASTYGVPADSSLADWPIAYSDLEPDYSRAEREIGVCGDAAGNAYAGVRTSDYPMPPFPANAAAKILAGGAEALGRATSAVPLLINSQPYNGRGACIRCGMCLGFACPGDFKNDTRNTALRAAVATGRCDILVGAQVLRIPTAADGRVIGVDVAVGQQGTVRTITAERVILSCGAIETARLLLNSRSEREPSGLGNNHDQVGRNLQGHVYAGAVCVFDNPVQDCVGPGPGIATNDYRHHNWGVIGGGMIANDFVPMPVYVYYLGVSSGLVPKWGVASKQAMRHLYPRLQVIMGPIQEIPRTESRVTIDSAVRDRFGLPVARISGKVHPETLITARYIAQRAVEWAKASGASTVKPMVIAPADGPSAGHHQAGTCRMGDDPATSVTDKWGLVWGHDNLYVADGSLHVTNGGVNPVLTIMALAYRVSGHLSGSR